MALEGFGDGIREAGFSGAVVMGMGGSSLSGKTLMALKDQGFGPAAGRPRLWFMDNVDPATYAELLARLPLERTGFIPISKSGGTPETLAQLFAILDALEAKVGKATVGEIGRAHV